MPFRTAPAVEVARQIPYPPALRSRTFPRMTEPTPSPPSRAAPEPMSPRRTARLVAAVLGTLVQWAESGWSGAAALAWSLLQSSVVPGPSDAVLIPLAVADPRRAIRLSLWTVAGSVLGALIAYGIGALAYASVGLPVLHWLGVTSERLAHIEALFTANRRWFVAVASLPLLSSKAAAVVAGAFGMPVGEFAAITLLVRGGRFIGEGLILRFAGHLLRRRVRPDERA